MADVLLLTDVAGDPGSFCFLCAVFLGTLSSSAHCHPRHTVILLIDTLWSWGGSWTLADTLAVWSVS